jgi:hypothetical protein
MAFNLTRAAGALASLFHARATTATIRRQLINIPARPVRSARRIKLRLPTNWPWADASTCSPPHAGHPPQRLPDHRPNGHDRRSVEKAGQTGSSQRPHRAHLERRSTGLGSNSLRCIRAQPPCEISLRRRRRRVSAGLDLETAPKLRALGRRAESEMGWIKAASRAQRGCRGGRSRCAERSAVTSTPVGW